MKEPAKEPKERGAVPVAVEALSKGVIDLTTVISRLEVKLQPVLSPIPPLAPPTAGLPDEKQVKEQQPPLVMNITEISDNLQTLKCRLQELTERCQL